MACGYEAPIEDAPRWKHPGYDGADPSCCVGYLIRQPDVVSISRLKLHWDRGAAPGRLDARTSLLVEEMEIQSNAASGYSQREAIRGARNRGGQERPQ